MNVITTMRGVLEAPTIMFQEELDCQSSTSAVRLLLSMTGLSGQAFWVQPDLINNLRKKDEFLEDNHVAGGPLTIFHARVPTRSLTEFFQRSWINSGSGRY